ncbi:unnamed protein product [Paramecium sonneborni]|uniref:C2H2-type domain-containing protein n=1 Tax=Paramecium sonneborni TaxID=65129 RepID=A0A8S1N886_9CILI|nr:unnamed protein product [Paramecium sonneborni]
MQSPNNLQLLTKMKRCRKNMIKLQEKINLLATIIDQQSIPSQKDFQQNLPHTEQKPDIIIDDDDSVEIILSLNELEPVNQQQDLKPIAKKLISRFYYHIGEKMKESSLNQLQALQLLCNKEFKDNPYKQLFQGFQKLYINTELKCKQCNHQFSNLQQSSNHVLYSHLNDLSIFICIQCKLTFQNQDKLDNHIIQLHHLNNNIPNTQINLQQKPENQVQKQPINEINKINQIPDLNQINHEVPPQPIMQKIFIPSEYTQTNNHVKQQDQPPIKQPSLQSKIKIIKKQFFIAPENFKEEQNLLENLDDEVLSKNNQKPQKIKIKLVTKTNQSFSN